MREETVEEMIEETIEEMIDIKIEVQEFLTNQFLQENSVELDILFPTHEH